MRQWFKSSSSKRVAGVVASAVLVLGLPLMCAAVTEREPVTMSVVTVNPSDSKPQSVPIKIFLPKEVTPKDVLDNAGLALQYDDSQAIYYLFKDAVPLAPKETKVFQVIVRDVWYVPEDQISSLRSQAQLLLGRLEKSSYADTAKQLGAQITQQLDGILSTQNDESLGRKTRIGAYRQHLVTLEQVKEELAQMEKLLAFAGGTPVPEMLEKSPLKSDAPSTKTTWLIIFMVVIFVGLLGGLFFFTWFQRARLTDVTSVKQFAFPTGSEPTPPETPAGPDAPSPPTS